MALNIPSNITLSQVPQGQSFTNVYASPLAPAQGTNTSPFSAGNCGYQGDVGWSAPKNQIITINTSIEGGGNIFALLNKPFSMATSSEWESFIPAAPAIAEITTQAISTLAGQYTSLFNQFTTRRIWKGTSALKLSLELYFYAVNNAYNEVLEPCIRLQRLALPTVKVGSVTNGLALLTPPGPDPFSFSSGQYTGGEIVTITVGGLMTFSPVIVKEPIINFDQKSDQNGHPMSATATIQFETYQLLTKEDLSGLITPHLSGSGNSTAATGTSSPITPLNG